MVLDLILIHGLSQWEQRHIKWIDVVVPEVTELGKLAHNVYYAKNPVHCALVAIGVVVG